MNILKWISYENFLFCPFKKAHMIFRMIPNFNMYKLLKILCFNILKFLSYRTPHDLIGIIYE